MDLIDACGQTLKAALGLPYAGQEPQNKDSVPGSGLVIIERVGGSMTQFARSDQPWIQFTVLASSKKKAWDLLRRVRGVWGEPHTQVGPVFTRGVTEVLAPEDASLVADPFYRVRCAYRFDVNGLA